MCIIRSPNFTSAAFSDNIEIAVRLDSTSANARGTYDLLRRIINEHWSLGKQLTQDMLNKYRSIWELKKPERNSLAGAYGSKHRNPSTPTEEIELLTLTWSDFVSRVKHEEHDAFEMRVEVLRRARAYFRSKTHLANMEKEERRRIAGLPCRDSGTDWGYFGSMKGAGWFQKAINANDRNLSDAIDAVPSDGLVVRSDFDAFVRSFRKSFPEGERVAVATRLMSMKRPDMFVCLDARNRSGLCKALGIPQSDMSFDRYWNEIIERVRDAVWWNAPRPSVDIEREMWLGRAAFLDSLYYME